MRDQDPQPDDGVLFDSPRTSPAWKAVVSLATGATLCAFMSFIRWAAREGPLGAVSAPAALLGVAVSCAMLTTALSSRVARRVEVVPANRSLVVHRDPAAVETFALADLAEARSELPPGGWSRDPAEDLVLVLRDGTTRRFSLPDEADTPAIVRDLVTHLEPLRARA
jgi:hypothetical protein